MYQNALTTIRGRVIFQIKKAVTDNGNCIGTFFRNKGERYQQSQEQDMYTNPPIAVVHNNDFQTYGKMKAATVYDLFINADNEMFLTLNGESGEDFDQPVENITTESLVVLLQWLQQEGLQSNDNIYFNHTLKKLEEDDALCEKLMETLQQQSDSDDEPLSKKGQSLIEAYRNQDIEGVMFAICGWTFHAIVYKTIDIDDDALHEGSTLLEKMQAKLQEVYIPEKYDDDTIYEMALNEFFRIKNEVCLECLFDEEAFQMQNSGDTPFDELKDEFCEELYKKMLPEKPEQSFETLLCSLSLIANMDSGHGVLEAIAMHYRFSKLHAYFKSMREKVLSDEYFVTDADLEQLKTKEREMLDEIRKDKPHEAEELEAALRNL